jgi:glycosyltransferase involved in cell wall biosynthesis
LLASCIGGSLKFVADGEQALLISPGDHAALAAGLAHLCDDSERARNLGRQAQRSAAQNMAGIQCQVSD